MAETHLIRMNRLEKAAKADRAANRAKGIWREPRHLYMDFKGGLIPPAQAVKVAYAMLKSRAPAAHKAADRFHTSLKRSDYENAWDTGQAQSELLEVINAIEAPELLSMVERETWRAWLKKRWGFVWANDPGDIYVPALGHFQFMRDKALASWPETIAQNQRKARIKGSPWVPDYDWLPERSVPYRRYLRRLATGAEPEPVVSAIEDTATPPPPAYPGGQFDLF